jgi:hypothetical protein
MGDCTDRRRSYNPPIMSRRIVTIMLLALVPPAVLNGYPLTYPCVPAVVSQDIMDGDEADATEDDGAEDSPPIDDAPATGTPVMRMQLLTSAPIDYSWRAFRTFSPVQSRSLPVGLWHGQSLSVPRPFSRLDRVVAMSRCDAASLTTLARHVQPHAPPSSS